MGWSWEDMEGHKVMGEYGRTWVMGGHGITWEDMEGHGRTYGHGRTWEDLGGHGGRWEDMDGRTSEDMEGI